MPIVIVLVSVVCVKTRQLELKCPFRRPQMHRYSFKLNAKATSAPLPLIILQKTQVSGGPIVANPREVCPIWSTISLFSCLSLEFLPRYPQKGPWVQSVEYHSSFPSRPWNQIHRLLLLFLLMGQDLFIRRCMPAYCQRRLWGRSKVFLPYLYFLGLGPVRSFPNETVCNLKTRTSLTQSQ